MTLIIPELEPKREVDINTLGDAMDTWFTRYLTYSFAFFCFSFLAVHFAHMKSPVQNRQTASFETKFEKWPRYDASFKY